MPTTTITADELRRRADRLDDAARQTPDDYLASQLRLRAARMRQQADGGTPIERLREALDGPCADCNGTGERVLNPNWPSGSEPYSEKCSTCSGVRP